MNQRKKDLNILYLEGDKIMLSKKRHKSHPAAAGQEPRPALKPRLEFGAWNLEFAS
jgi:hypothetical protein